MSQFASKTPRDLNHDPEPFSDERGNRWIIPATFQPRTFTYDPRPEFDHVQHNPVNPILTSLRKRLQYQRDDGRPSTTPIIARTMLKAVDTFEFYGVLSATPEQAAHARKVLTKLAALKEVSA